MLKNNEVQIYLFIRNIFIVLIVSFSCEKFVPASPSDEDLLEGPISGLSTQEINQFLRGDEAFNEVFTTQNGLGPLFVASSCGACHSGDGKGHLLTTLTRFGQVDSTGNHFIGLGGPQLQNRALPGYIPEQIPAGASSSKFTPPAVTGLGYLSAVSDESILSYSDPYDLDGDGISGVPNWIEIPSYIIPLPNAITNRDRYIGRFGKRLRLTIYCTKQSTLTIKTWALHPYFTHLMCTADWNLILKFPPKLYMM